MRLLTAAILASVPIFASAGELADLEVFDRTRGQELAVHEYQGQWYVAGEPGHQYELRVRNRSPQRLLAVTSVDSVNVVSGETAATDQRGYVLDPWSSVAIEGWRKSLDEVATFYFTPLPDSYAARTGRPDDVGVIGVALFREAVPHPCCEYPDQARAHANATAEAGASDSESGARQRSEKRLGTGHGQRESSLARYVDFRRGSVSPDETLVIYYDSRRNLVAQGVLPALPRKTPQPFPAGFVVDP